MPSRRGGHQQHARPSQERTQIDSHQRPHPNEESTTTAMEDAPSDPPSSIRGSTSLPAASPEAVAESNSQGHQYPAQEARTTTQALSQHGTTDGYPHASTDQSWDAVFETLLDSQGRNGMVENATVTFLGESFPLAHLLETISQRGGIHILHPPEASNDEVLSPRYNHPAHLAEEDVQYLAAKHCLNMPVKQCSDVLVSAFVDRVYPLYPVVVLHDFLADLRSGSLSLLLLNAVCCAGSSFCNLADLTPLGFKSRKDARDTFYRRAKLLFDFGYESNKITILQSTTLMSFWPSKPQDTWTFYHYIGFSVTLAESLGVHRSMAQANMSGKNRSLLKRIWFALVIRDAWGAALYGRPFRINDRQCDADQPTLDDFECDVLDWDMPPSIRTARLYFVQASSLALILRNVISLRSSSQTPADQYDATIERVRADLEMWNSSLPPELDWSVSNAHNEVHSAILSVLYNNTLILAHLPSATAQHSVNAARSTASPPLPKSDASVDMVRAACESILSTASLLVTQNQLVSVPHEMFTGIFLAQVLLYKGTTADDPNASKLAKSQTECFQMVFHQIKDLWEPASWIMHLFRMLTERSDGKQSTPIRYDYDWPEDTTFPGDTFADLQQYLGDFNVFDPAWASHPGLDGLFE